MRTLLLEGLGLEFKLTADEVEFDAYAGPKLAYGRANRKCLLTICPHGLLFDHGIKDYHIQVKTDPHFEKTFFQSGKDERIPFDIFSASFWLLSRYEEYLPHKADTEGRFSYKSGLAYQYNFLHIPLVNLWLHKFQEILKDIYPHLQLKTHTYRFTSTVDVDNVYKYKYKGFVRTLAGFLADKGLSERLQRWKILLGKAKDPFDCYDFLIDAHNKFGIHAAYFFLLGDYGPNDKNHASTDLRFQSLIKHLADYSKVGLHPSYASNNHPKQLRKELARLANITHRYITMSRQHFSMLLFPQTYKNLLQAGLTRDYSMGYTNCNGFRASYCFPYRWYSLDIESVSTLTIYPYCISEVTLKSEADKHNSDMLHEAMVFINQVKKYRGELITVFHNHMFNEEIRAFYLRFIQVAQTVN